MALRKKLYYDILLTNPGGEGVTFKVGGGPAVALATPAGVAIKFVTSSGTYGNNANPDRYGNLMGPNQYVGASGNGRKTVQSIGGWYVASTYAPYGTVLRRPTPLAVDFIPETGLVFTAVVGIDPASVRRPRARVRFIGADLSAQSSISGTLYLQRQHSIEV